MIALQQCDMLEDVRAPPGTFALYEGLEILLLTMGLALFSFVNYNR